MPPAFTITLILCFPTWVTVDALRLMFDRWPRVRPIALVWAAFVVGIMFCSFPGFLDLLLYDVCGYASLGYVNGPAYGVLVGAAATTLHAVGLRKGLTHAFVGSVGRLFRARGAPIAVTLALLGVQACASTCTRPEIVALVHGGGLPSPAGRLVLRCGDKTWEVDVGWAPHACLDAFGRCMTPPAGWTPGAPLPPGWAPPECSR